MSNSDINDSSNSLEEKCLDLANRLIRLCKRPYPRVQSIRHINSDLIIWLFENITQCSIPDLLLCTNNEEEAHNIQAVIDTLSLDLLGISLSHIVGEDIVAGNLVAICNLLEILEGVTLYTPVNGNKENRSGVLKRKITKKKKIASKRKSKTRVDSFSSSAVSKDEKHEGNTSESVSGFTEPKLLKVWQSRNVSRHDSSISRHFSQEKIITSEYAFSSSNTSPPSKLRRNDYLTVSCEKSSLSEEVDHAIFSKSDQKQLTIRTSSKNSSSEKKLHFQIEKATTMDKYSTESNKMPSTSQGNKRISSELPGKREAISSVRKEQEVEKLYERNMKEKVKFLLEKDSSIKPRASSIKRLQLQNMQKPYKRSFSACRKSFLLPHSLRRQSISRTTLKKKSSPKTNIHQDFLKKADETICEKSKSGFIGELFQEFPGLQLTPSVINHINKKYQQHLLKMYKQMKNCLLKKSKSQLQADEAAKRQSLIFKLLKKNIQEEQYMQKLKEKNETENKVKYHLRDARLQSAKMKQYYDEFHTELRKKMQKRNYTEELILENMFTNALEIQKEQVNYLCQQVKEAEEDDAKQHLAYLDALENLYQTQFSMISEALITEKMDSQERINTQKQTMRSMQREFQEELKKEIRFMQKVIVECIEDTHFREMDAELYKTKLRKKYS
ncbi:hypothetical protein NPIL_358121 [Nephila pilipes]|uniref:DUF5745 domain-containing protein n=1 Tax=Nephila pilipes TaxID=299642 RepID=A0A8X6P4H0_NEPPI|nr:hypothetical protein NPIL_358121 [Nephila pilipes]